MAGVVETLTQIQATLRAERLPRLLLPTDPLVRAYQTVFQALWEVPVARAGIAPYTLYRKDAIIPMVRHQHQPFYPDADSWVAWQTDHQNTKLYWLRKPAGGVGAIAVLTNHVLLEIVQELREWLHVLHLEQNLPPLK